MRTTILHRHDISDKLWNKIEKVLPGRKGSTGRPAMDNRKFLNAVFWILRTGAPWRDLPPEFGDWKNTHRRFSRWRDKGIWEKILTEVTLDYDTEWIMIDSTYCKCHQHAAGARGGNQAIGLTKGESSHKCSKVKLVDFVALRRICLTAFYTFFNEIYLKLRNFLSYKPANFSKLQAAIAAAILR